MAFLLLVALAIFATPAFSQTTEVPERVSYQGIVTDKLGNLLAPTDPGNYEVVFRVWDSPTGGTTPVYSEKQTITIFKGEFSALVGAGADVTGEEASGPSNVSIAQAFNNASRYLGVTVASAPATPVSGSDPEITPRQQIVTTPFAFRSTLAETVAVGGVNTGAISDSSITLPKLGTGSVDSLKIVDGSVGTADLAGGSVTAGILAGGSVTSAAILDGAVGTLDLADGSVTSLKILNGTVATVDLDDSAVTNAKIANGSVTLSKLGSDVGTWTANGANLYRFSGNVGIGTTIPSKSLHVYDGASGNPVNSTAVAVLEDNSNAYLQINSPNSSYAGILFGRNGRASEGGISFTPSEDLTFLTGNNLTRMTVKADGKVGIGTTNPAATLTVTGNMAVGATTAPANETVNLFNIAAGETDDGAVNGITFWETGKAYGMSLGYDGSGGGGDNALRFYKNGGSSFMSMTADGFIGIGTETPDVPLHVVSSAVETFTLAAYLSPAGAANPTDASFSTSIGIWSNQGISANIFLVYSDERIKDVLGISNASDDLDTLKSIEVVDYQLKDKVAGLGRPVKKVVAQQVERVYPQAVSRTTDVVPDIYRKGMSVGGWIQCETDLSVGEQVRIIGDEGPALHEVVETGEDRFRVTEALPDGEVFVYGRRVDDFRVVDYEAIAMLNVSATQELARENEALKKRLAELEAKERARDAKLVAIEALLKSGTKPAVQTASLGGAE